LEHRRSNEGDAVEAESHAGVDSQADADADAVAVAVAVAVAEAAAEFPSVANPPFSWTVLQLGLPQVENGAPSFPLASASLACSWDSKEPPLLESKELRGEPGGWDKSPSCALIPLFTPAFFSSFFPSSFLLSDLKPRCKLFVWLTNQNKML